MDVEISASGFTKEMNEDLDNAILHQKSDDESDDDDDSNSENNSEEENESHKDKDPLESTSKQKTQAYEFQKLETKLDLEELEKYHSEVKEDSTELAAVRQRLESVNFDDMASLSGFSVATSQATIAPEVIKNRVKKSFQRADKANVTKRIRAKGEASAATRSRRANMDNIKQSTAIDSIWG